MSQGFPQRRACVRVTASLPCDTVSDCPAGATCEESVCKRLCVTSVDCGDGGVCASMRDGGARTCAEPLRASEHVGADAGQRDVSDLSDVSDVSDVSDASDASDASDVSDVAPGMDVATDVGSAMDAATDVRTGMDVAGDAPMFTPVCDGSVCSTFLKVVVARDLVLAQRSDGLWYGWGGPLAGTTFPWASAPASPTRVGAIASGDLVVTSPTEPVIAFGNTGVAGGTLSVVGVNASGRLGTGAAESTSVPRSMVRGGTAAADALFASFGAVNGCLVLSSSRVVNCWGDRTLGVAGPDSLVDLSLSAQGTSPVRYPLGSGRDALLDARSVAVGDRVACALLSAPEGDVYCWGSNGASGVADGALGVGRSDPGISPYAVRVPLSGAATSLAVSRRTACALVAGEVWCWGSNQDLLLGAGAGGFATSPVRRGVRATQLALGGDFACVVDDVGALRCWGRGADHRLSTVSVSDQSEPVAAVDDTGAAVRPRYIAVSRDGGCALCADDTLRCWGQVVPGVAGSVATPAPFAR